MCFSFSCLQVLWTQACFVNSVPIVLCHLLLVSLSKSWISNCLMRILKLLVRLYINANCSLKPTSGVASLSHLHPWPCPFQAPPSGVTRLLFPPNASLHPPFQPFFYFFFIYKFLVYFLFLYVGGCAKAHRQGQRAICGSWFPSFPL